MNITDAVVLPSVAVLLSSTIDATDLPAFERQCFAKCPILLHFRHTVVLAGQSDFECFGLPQFQQLLFLDTAGGSDSALFTAADVGDDL